MRQYLEKLLISQQHLTQEEAYQALLSFSSDETNEVQMSAFLTAYICHPPTGAELSGFRQAMLEQAVRVQLEGDKRIDIVGTGGDGKNTFNISTTAALIVAGAGYKVTKHGSYGVSSNCGASDVLANLGYEFSTDQQKLQNDLNKGNFCFLHAPLFHPAMKKVVPVRKALELRTFFNILGPLLNPSYPTHQVSGVFSPAVLYQYQAVFEAVGISYSVLYDEGGYDEISLTNDVTCITNDVELIYASIDFDEFDISPNAIKGGGTVEESAQIILNILQGKGTAAQQAVATSNASLAIRLVEECSLSEAKDIAEEAIVSQKAYNCLKAVCTR